MSAFANVYDSFKILLDEIAKQKGIEFSRWHTQELLSKVIPYLSLAPSATQRPRKLISRRGWAWPHPSKALNLFLRRGTAAGQMGHPSNRPPVRKTGGHVKDFQGRIYRRRGLFVASGRDGMGLKKSQQQQ